MKLDLEYLNNIFTIKLQGRLTKRTVYKLNNYVIPLIIKHKIKNIVINIEGIKEIDEVGVDMLLKIKCIERRFKGNVYLEGENNNHKSIKRLHLKKKDTEKI